MNMNIKLEPSVLLLMLQQKEIENLTLRSRIGELEALLVEQFETKEDLDEDLDEDPS